jgi:hypothetical protein
MRPTVVLTLFALNPVLADSPTSPTSRGDRTPDTLLVTATRTERAIEDVAATARSRATLAISCGTSPAFKAADALGGVAAYRAKGAAGYLFCSFIKAGDSA